MSFVNITSDACFASVIVIPSAKSCYEGQLYNGTWLYYVNHTLSQTLGTNHPEITSILIAVFKALCHIHNLHIICSLNRDSGHSQFALYQSPI